MYTRLGPQTDHFVEIFADILKLGRALSNSLIILTFDVVVCAVDSVVNKL